MIRPVFTEGVRVSAKLWISRLALFWESVWPALWPPLGVCGLFLAAALFDLFPVLPGWLHSLALLSLAAAFAWTVYRALPAFRLPSAAAARRRLELSSELPHRPLSLSRDRIDIGRGDPEAEALWRAHRRRMLARIKALAVEAPRPGLPRRDPWALRGALILLLVVGLSAGWNDASNRLARALSPQLAALGAGLPVSLDVWITPPAYTGLAPRFLRFGAVSAEHGQPATDASVGLIEVPAGSTLMAQVHGGRGTPRLRVAGIEQDFEPISSGDGARTFQYSGEIERAGRMAVIQRGTEVGAWTLAITGDEAPRIAFVNPPAGTPRGSLRLEYKAQDDFGVTEASATIRRPQDRPDANAEDAIKLKLPLPGTAPKTAQSASYHDLTAHIWAGLPVEIRLAAKDALGQTGESEVVEIVLPERLFRNRLAQLLVEMRKQLTLDQNKSTRRDIARMAARRALKPEDYRDDVVVFLALKSIHDRLLRDESETAVGEVQQLMWDTALRIEDGETSLAERALLDAQQALQDALERGADDAELQELLDQLQQAMDEFFQALAEDMRRNPEKYQGALPPTPDMDIFEAQDLQRMLDQIREMATTGAREAARQLLSQLRDLLENLRMGMAGRMPQGENPAQQMMNSLEQLARRQQELLDQTFRDAQRQNESGREGQRPDTSGRAADQEALRRMLGDLMRQMDELTGQIPEALGRAERAMRDASRALEQGQPGRALGSQGEALEQLRAGMGQAMQQLAQQFGQQLGFNPGNQGFRRGNRDPLGRRYDSNGNAWGTDVKVPDEAEVRRARQILDELRRRSGEPHREVEELDYIDRLLKRF
ncbi:MAG: TIGR02302 family protein [Alphaproteobacteria bacterium]|nr:TIGR02302 family protein [Alphaproteobacteria bacterium]